MKRYLAPELEICAFRAEDIVTASGFIEGLINNIMPSPAEFNGKLTKFTDQDEE